MYAMDNNLLAQAAYDKAESEKTDAQKEADQELAESKGKAEAEAAKEGEKKQDL